MFWSFLHRGKKYDLILHYISVIDSKMVFKISLVLKLVRKNRDANEPGAAQLAEVKPANNPIALAHNLTSLSIKRTLRL